jgi:hypothetical protein
MPVIIGSPLINFFPGVRGDDERTLDEEVNWSSTKNSFLKKSEIPWRLAYELIKLICVIGSSDEPCVT